MKRFNTYFRMLAYIKPYIGVLALTFILSLIITSSESLALWFSGSLVKSIFAPGLSDIAKPAFSISHANEILKYYTAQLIEKKDPLDSLKIVCFCIILFFFLKNFFSYIKTLIVTQLNLHVSRDLRRHLYSHALKLPVTYYDRSRSGHILSLIFNDIAAINNSLTGTFDRLFTDPIRLVVFVTVLLMLSPRLTIIVFVTYPLLVLMLGQIGKVVRRRSKRSLENISGLVSVVNETIAGIRTVKTFNMHERENGRFDVENNGYMRNSYRAAVFNGLSSPLTETLSVLVTAALLWFGGQDVLAGKNFAAEDFIRFLAFLFMAYQPIKSLGHIYNTIQTGIAGAERVFDILDRPAEKLTARLQVTQPAFTRDINLSHVRFTYPGTAEEVIRDVSFTIRKGDIVALVGSSGSGKTTILDLLPRFYDISSGAITIDNANIAAMDLAGLRSLFGIVSQETVLFNASVIQNITYGIPEATKEKTIEAARAAQAWEFIEKMPQGLDTVIGERGVMLSGGQRQRLAIARALLANPPILILDEATSALDSESERLVQDAINRLMQDRTALVVAHRLSTIMHANRIIVLEEGKIAEMGTHKELMELGGKYKYFHGIQFASETGAA